METALIVMMNGRRNVIQIAMYWIPLKGEILNQIQMKIKGEKNSTIGIYAIG